jgi:hypothetical protein
MAVEAVEPGDRGTRRLGHPEPVADRGAGMTHQHAVGRGRAPGRPAGEMDIIPQARSTRLHRVGGPNHRGQRVISGIDGPSAWRFGWVPLSLANDQKSRANSMVMAQDLSTRCRFCPQLGLRSGRRLRRFRLRRRADGA